MTPLLSRRHGGHGDVSPWGGPSSLRRGSRLIVGNRSAAQQGNVEPDALRVTRSTAAQNAAETLGVSDPNDVTGQFSAAADTESLSIGGHDVRCRPGRRDATRWGLRGRLLPAVNADLLTDQDRRFAELQQQIDAAGAQQ